MWELWNSRKLLEYSPYNSLLKIIFIFDREAQSLLVPIAENVESMYLYEILLLLAEIYLVNYESEKAGEELWALFKNNNLRFYIIWFHSFPGQIINRIETSFSKVKQARTSVQETKEKSEYSSCS